MIILILFLVENKFLKVKEVMPINRLSKEEVEKVGDE